MKNRHVIETLGLSRVTVEDGKIVEVTPPKLDYCPLFARLQGFDKIDENTIRQNIEFRIKDFGLFTENREIRGDDCVSFGVSEILSCALRNGKISAACIVSDGCGSAIITDPELLQGLCGRISGTIETSPLNVVLNAVGRDNVIDPNTTPINQLAIQEIALKRDYNKFAVTVCKAKDAVAIRKLCGSKAVIVGVHTSGVSPEDQNALFENCDFITACASGRIRKIAFQGMKENKYLIAGNKVQIIAVTDIGKEIVGDKLKSLGRKFWDGNLKTDDPSPFLD